MKKGPIIKVAVLGAESTGKTRLCEQLAAHYSTAWVPEYARDYFHGSDIYNYTLQDLINIAKEQLRLEEEGMRKANRILFCDTTLITLKIWAELEFQACPQYIIDGMATSHYHLYLITANDIPWEADALRQNKHSRDLLQRMNLREVEKTGKPYSIVEGLHEARLTQSVEVIENILRG